MAGKETGFLRGLYNYLTDTGVSVRRTTDFLGRPVTKVTNYDTGVKRVHTHNAGFLGIKDKMIERDRHGQTIGTYEGKRHWLTGSYSGRYEGVCFSCDGSGRVRLKCRKCDGSGTYHGKCARCSGTGVYTNPHNHKKAPCRKCGGTGSFSANCKKCNGLGHFSATCRKCGGSGRYTK